MVAVFSSTKLSLRLSQIFADSDAGVYDLAGTHSAAIEQFDSLLTTTDPIIDVLASNQVALRWPTGAGDFRLVLSGHGIGPISSFDALVAAIENGLADGSIDTVRLQKSGGDILLLTLSPTGYVLTSGVDRFTLSGAMPTSFAQMTELAQLLGQLDGSTIAAMSPLDRSAYFDKMSAFGLTGFSIGSDGETFMSLAVTATTLTLQMADLTLVLSGTLPTDFGDMAALAYDVFRLIEVPDTAFDFSVLTGLGVNSVVITDDAGGELLRLTGPVGNLDQPVDSHVLTGTDGNDLVDLEDQLFSDPAALTVNLGKGNDTLRFSTDELVWHALYEGTPLAEMPVYRLNGGAGSNRLQVDSQTDTDVIIDLAAGTLEGHDSVSGATLYRSFISGFQKLELRGMTFEVTGSAGDDVVAMMPSSYIGGGALTFVGGAGTDTLDLATGLGTTLAMLQSNAHLSRDGAGGLVLEFDSTPLGSERAQLLDVEALRLSNGSGGTFQYALTGLISTTLTVTTFSDRLLGSYLNETFNGSPGDDTLIGFGGNDWLTPGAGADLVDGGAGVDMVSFVEATSRAVIDLGRGTAVIAGQTDRLSGVENLTATIFADMITGDAGSNRIRALGDFDWMVGSGGNDTYEGGTGRDTVAYSSAAAGVIANLLTGTGTAGQAAGDRYIEVECLTGGSFGDRLTGNTDRNILRGLGGDDFLFGLAGNDTLDGGAGRDHLNGGLGTDRITGGRGNDTIDGGGGWDTALFTGTRAQYSVTENADGSTSVLHKSGGVDGIDLLINIDVLEFSDGRLFL